MKFNLVYGNHSFEGVHISDTLRLIKYALQSIGHTVVLSSHIVAKENNILIENFTYDFIVVMEEMRKIEGTKFILLATEYISDQERFNYFPNNTVDEKSHYGYDRLWEKRWKTFCLAVKNSDAIWHLSESQVCSYQARFKNTPVGYLPHAYLPELIKLPKVEPQHKDIDVLFTGTLTPYREIIINNLRAAGLEVVVGKINTPDHIREDWISRSKIALNLKQNANWLYPSNSRFFYHIMNNSYLITEQCDESCDLDDYVEHVSSINLISKVKDALQQDTTHLAEENLKLFMKNRPMQPLIAELVDTTCNFK